MRRFYSDDTKLKAVKMYADGIGAPTIVKTLGLSCKRLVYDWVKAYQTYEKNAFTVKIDPSDIDKKLLEAQIENAVLKKLYKRRTGKDFSLKKN